MELTIFWTDFATDALKGIFDYYSSSSGSIKVAQELVDSLVDYSIILEKHPEMGRKEPLLSERPQKFRYLIFKNYKIIYWVNRDKSRIDIAHVFDMRQDPSKLQELE